MTPTDLVALWANPARAGAQATAVRKAGFSSTVRIIAAPKHARPQSTVILRGSEIITSPAWPEPNAWQPGDRLVLSVPADAASRMEFASWLLDATVAPTLPSTVAPTSNASAGLHKLWCIAAARLALPPTVRIEARHDLLGIRLAQIALGFGADTLSGPIAPNRTLPLAGITRPDEATVAGLSNLVRTASWTPAVDTFSEHDPHGLS